MWDNISSWTWQAIKSRKLSKETRPCSSFSLCGNHHTTIFIDKDGKWYTSAGWPGGEKEIFWWSNADKINRSTLIYTDASMSDKLLLIGLPWNSSSWKHSTAPVSLCLYIDGQQPRCLLCIYTHISSTMSDPLQKTKRKIYIYRKIL